jgi:glycosyltransferase involved in cell wall biosynthesis
MRNADALVLPSYWEGVPTVVLEAMASGIPVISTRVGDVPNFITHLENGLLIDRTLGSFEKAVSTVLNDASTVELITHNARRLVEMEFSIARVSQGIEAIYAEIHPRC